MSAPEPTRDPSRRNEVVEEGYDLRQRSDESAVLFAETWKFRVYHNRISVGCIDEPIGWWEDEATVRATIEEKVGRIPREIAKKHNTMTEEGLAAAKAEAAAVLLVDWTDYRDTILGIAAIRAERRERHQAERERLQAEADREGARRLAEQKRREGRA